MYNLRDYKIGWVNFENKATYGLYLEWKIIRVIAVYIYLLPHSNDDM